MYLCILSLPSCLTFQAGMNKRGGPDDSTSDVQWLRMVTSSWRCDRIPVQCTIYTRITVLMSAKLWARPGESLYLCRCELALSLLCRTLCAPYVLVWAQRRKILLYGFLKYHIDDILSNRFAHYLLPPTIDNEEVRRPPLTSFIPFVEPSSKADSSCTATCYSDVTHRS